MIHAIVLAAGRSVRMGEQKLLMPFDGAPIIHRVISTVLSCGFDGVSVVVSRETLSRLSPPCGAGRAQYIVNPDPDRGQGSSFHCGLSGLPEGSSFAVFLGDMPAVTETQITLLRQRFELSAARGKTALVPLRDGAPGHPAFYSHIWRGRFIASEGSGKTTLFRYGNEVEWAETGGGVDENLFLDIDTPDDYRRLTALCEHTSHILK